MSHCHLASLPNEVLLLIVHEIHPGDIESFALSNKQFHAISLACLQRHRAFKRQYSVLRFGRPDGWSEEFAQERHPLFYLDELFRNPRLAYYPIKLRIGKLCDSSFAHPSYGSIDALNSMIMNWKSQILALMRRNPWIKNQVTRNQWRVDLIDCDGLSHHIAILLTMLPNLQSISLADVGHNTSELTQIVSLIAAANRDSTSPVYGKALSNLREVLIESTDHHPWENVQDFGPFAELRSMRALSGRSICDEFFNNSDGPTQFEERNDIEEISMTECAIKSSVFRWLLGGIRSLKRFTYSYKRDDSLPEDQDFCGIFSALKKYARHSLEMLDVTVDLATLRADNRDDDYWIGDLKRFKCLRSLRLDGIFFEMPWSRDASKEEEFWDGETAYLEEVLPASIRKVTLVKTSNLEDPAALFDGLAEAKAQNFPELQEIIVEECFTVPKGVLEECEKVGIVTTGVKMSTDMHVPDLGTGEMNVDTMSCSTVVPV